MDEPTLPIMAPATWRPASRVAGGRWARRDIAPPFKRLPRPGVTPPEEPYEQACGREVAGPLGLCAHHEAQIFPPEVRRAPAPAGP